MIYPSDMHNSVLGTWYLVVYYINGPTVTNTRHFITFSVNTNIYNKKTKGPTLMEFFTATGKLKKFFF